MKRVHDYPGPINVSGYPETAHKHLNEQHFTHNEPIAALKGIYDPNTLPSGVIPLGPPECTPSQTPRHHADEYASQDPSLDSSEDAELHPQPRKRRKTKQNYIDVSSEEVLPTKPKPNNRKFSPSISGEAFRENRKHYEQKRRDLSGVGLKQLQQLVPELNAGDCDQVQVLTKAATFIGNLVNENRKYRERLEALEGDRAKRFQWLWTQWEERWASLLSRLQVQTPQDITGHQQASEDKAALQSIAIQLNILVLQYTFCVSDHGKT
ncbi:hypothetical protein H2199_005761 [Coniosporium tulheliwenetii]|uniref:Uncharacterized protein n=1 Tax=Coniosporium tulheliwenetii TaxID=3383036 RepID=A0ACC2Z1H7_9PEZI|nr:hypothetical protein H2199_005761 [Cladosporium sp. JES 115]